MDISLIETKFMRGNCYLLICELVWLDEGKHMVSGKSCLTSASNPTILVKDGNAGGLTSFFTIAYGSNFRDEENIFGKKTHHSSLVVGEPWIILGLSNCKRYIFVMKCGRNLIGS